MKDLSHLPLASQTTERMFGPPDSDTLLADVISQWLWQNRTERPMGNSEAKFRHSWAGTCARRVAYWMTGEEEEPFSPASLWRFYTGQIVHDAIQTAAKEILEKQGYTVTLENETSLMEGFTTGHGDLLLVTPEGEVISLEIKSVGGFKYKKQVGIPTNPNGPDNTALVQGSLNATAEKADELKLVSLSLENVSLGKAKTLHLSPTAPFHAEWTLTTEQFLPIAAGELTRVKGIWDKIQANDGNPDVIARHVPNSGMPSGARIVNVDKSLWHLVKDDKVVDTGSLWNGSYCDYCPFQQRCKAGGA